MSTRTSLGATGPSVERRAGILDILSGLDEPIETQSLIPLLEQAQVRLHTHGRYDMVNADLKFMEKRGLVAKTVMKRDGLPGKAARWAIAR